MLINLLDGTMLSPADQINKSKVNGLLKNSQQPIEVKAAAAAATMDEALFERSTHTDAHAKRLTHLFPFSPAFINCSSILIISYGIS